MASRTWCWVNLRARKEYRAPSKAKWLTRMPEWPWARTFGRKSRPHARTGSPPLPCDRGRGSRTMHFEWLSPFASR
eukprot:7055980-Lingulodinium_polyedra.AAC.1